MPEYDFVYAKGEGKAALKLQTQNVAGKLAAGSLFTGKMGQINIWKMSADLEWGIPFTERPAALEGYACYKPPRPSTSRRIRMPTGKVRRTMPMYSSSSPTGKSPSS